MCYSDINASHLYSYLSIVYKGTFIALRLGTGLQWRAKPVPIDKIYLPHCSCRLIWLCVRVHMWFYLFLIVLHDNRVMCICTYMLPLASYYFFLIGGLDLPYSYIYHFHSVTISNKVSNQWDMPSSHLVRKKGLISLYLFWALLVPLLWATWFLLVIINYLSNNSTHSYWAEST